MNKQTDTNGQLNGISFYAKKLSGMMAGFTMICGFTMVYLLMS